MFGITPPSPGLPFFIAFFVRVCFVLGQPFFEFLCSTVSFLSLSLCLPVFLPVPLFPCFFLFLCCPCFFLPFCFPVSSCSFVVRVSSCPFVSGVSSYFAVSSYSFVSPCFFQSLCFTCFFLFLCIFLFFCFFLSFDFLCFFLSFCFLCFLYRQYPHQRTLRLASRLLELLSCVTYFGAEFMSILLEIPSIECDLISERCTALEVLARGDFTFNYWDLF